MIERDKPHGFVVRTMRNLRFIEKHRPSGAEVHEVTQLVLSLLGLVIFPRERHKRLKITPHYEARTLLELKEQHWPQWNISGEPITTLGRLLSVIRHAAAHGSITFSSDARTFREVHLTFESEDPPWAKRKKKRTWIIDINGEGLRQFCECLEKLILTEEQ